jgi:hypothetical protein
VRPSEEKKRRNSFFFIAGGTAIIFLFQPPPLLEPGSIVVNVLPCHQEVMSSNHNLCEFCFDIANGDSRVDPASNVYQDNLGSKVDLRDVDLASSIGL